MLTADQCFTQLEVLSKTGGQGALRTAEIYIGQVRTNEVERLRDKVQNASFPAHFASHVLDLLNALLAHRDG